MTTKLFEMIKNIQIGVFEAGQIGYIMANWLYHGKIRLNRIGKILANFNYNQSSPVTVDQSREIIIRSQFSC